MTAGSFGASRFWFCILFALTGGRRDGLLFVLFFPLLFEETGGEGVDGGFGRIVFRLWRLGAGDVDRPWGGLL